MVMCFLKLSHSQARNTPDLKGQGFPKTLDDMYCCM